MKHINTPAQAQAHVQFTPQNPAENAKSLICVTNNSETLVKESDFKVLLKMAVLDGISIAKQGQIDGGLQADLVEKCVERLAANLRV